ncbi:MAG: AarF/UbiB family protein [Spirochaetaceae bacterium]|nr:AarF/UbiB family protein [Spirochaetaceae bacterium]
MSSTYTPTADKDGNRKTQGGSRKKGFVGKAIGRVTRYSEIARVLIRYGFAEVVRKADTDIYRRLRGSSRGNRRIRRTLSGPERMRRALEELGPTFVKIGQLLSHRPDLLPPDWIDEFEKLRGEVPPIGIQEVRDAVFRELGSYPEDVFDDFEREPIASASIAQVHRARIRAAAKDNTTDGPADISSSPGVPAPWVAVKIQRPGISNTIYSDLAILRDFARLVNRHVPALAAFRPVEVVREIERAMRSELDFRNEADNLETFRRNFADDPHITAPSPLRDYSGRRILTMEYIDGVPVSNEEALEAMGAERATLARRGARAVLKQIFDHRFFHSDPHGNNILIESDGTIAFLDFGQAGSILPSQRSFLADLMAAIVRSDSVRAVRAILGWSGYRDPDIVRRLTGEMELVIERYLSRPFGRVDLGEMVSALFSLIRRFEIDIPSNFYLLAKAMATIEDIAGRLDPEFDFIRASQPFVKKMIRRELSPERITEEIIGASGDTLRFVRDLPGEARDLVSLLKAGRLRMEFELKDMKKLNSTLNHVVTRLSAAVLLAAMIMGSSLLVQSLIPPLMFGIPVIGILGFLFSGIVAVFLLIDLWRHR